MITEQLLAGWNADPIYIGADSMQIYGRGKMNVTRGVNTLTTYVQIDGQKWPVIEGNIALCDGVKLGVMLTLDGLSATLRNKRVTL